MTHKYDINAPPIMAHRKSMIKRMVEIALVSRVMGKFFPQF
jgi:hypothetical protein